MSSAPLPAHALAARLREDAPRLRHLPVVAGFDAFVDEIVRVVETREALDRYTPVATLDAMARHLAAAAGRSGLREIVVERCEAGGCAVNLGDGIAALGVPLDYVGTLGEPPHAAFAPFLAACRSWRTWGREPGRTLALEFGDGKYMLSAVGALAEFTPDALRERLRDGAFAAACRAARALAFTNWSMYPHMTACWRALQEGPLAAPLPHAPEIFVDLVDPRTRTAADMLAMLRALADFRRSGTVTLGLNGNEANALADTLGLARGGETPGSHAAQAAALRAAVGIDAVVIHGVRGAAAATAAGAAEADTPYCAAPRKLTGAGDRFNAGWLAGGLLGWSAPDRLVLANASSGFFVRRARSATAPELADFLEAWAAGRADDAG